MNEFEKYLKKGLSKGYYQSLLLKSFFNDFEKRIDEHLLKVNIAQTLLEWKREEGSKHQIHLEYPTNNFFSNAFKRFQFGKGIDFNRPIQEYESRPGFIDIAVTTNAFADPRSVYGIEVKPVITQYDKLFEDVERLNQAINNVDKRPEEKSSNSIEACYSIYIKVTGGNKRISSKINLERDKKRVASTIKKKLSSIYGDVKMKYSISVFEILSVPVEEITIPPSETDFYEVALKTGGVFGVLVKIEKNI
jgi:hypothetical protein